MYFFFFWNIHLQIIDFIYAIQYEYENSTAIIFIKILTY